MSDGDRRTMSEGKRQAMLEAAVAEFEAHGFPGASMDRVSARASVSKRTLYNHFESKDALFQAILDTLATDLNAAIDIRYTPGVAIREQLEALAWAEARLMQSPSFMRMIRLAMGEMLREPELSARMTSKYAHDKIFTAFFADAHDDGALAVPEPARAGAQMLGLLKCQAFWPALIAGAPIDSDEMRRVVDSTVEMMLAAYLPRG